MARVFIDGFESRTTLLWDGAGGFHDESNYQSGIGGGQYAFSPSVDSGITKSFSPLSTVYLRFTSGNTNVAPFGFVWLYFYNGATYVNDPQGIVVIDGEHVYVTNDYSGEESQHYYGHELCPHSWQIRFENIGTGEKRIQIKGDNVEVVDWTYSNTTPDELTTSKIAFYFHDRAAAIDNVVIDDAEWPGETCIFGMLPSANGSTIEWSPSSGENYQAVGSNVFVNSYYPPLTLPTAYVSSSTPGAIDIYEIGNAYTDESEVQTNALQFDEQVKCVQPQYFIHSGEHFQPCFYSGEFHYGGQLSGEYNWHLVWETWPVNPITSGEWGITDIQEMQTGMRLA